MSQALFNTMRRIDHWAVRLTTRRIETGAWDMKLRIAVLTLATFVAMC